MVFEFASREENAATMNASAKRPLISFITVSYNSASHIQETIASVAACKKLLSCEHVIIDGDSTDETKEILDENSQIIDQVIMEPDSGIYDAMNKGLSIARGEYVCFVNSDDRIIPRGAFRIAEMLQASRQHLDVVASAAIATDNETETLWLASKPDRFLVFRCPNLCHNGVYAHRSVFKRVGGFDPNLRIAADSDWIIRAYRCGSHFRITTTPTVFYALGGASSDVRLHADELLLIAKKNYPQLSSEVTTSLFHYLYAWQQRRNIFAETPSLSLRESIREASHYYPELSFLQFLLSTGRKQAAMKAYGRIRHALRFGAK